MLRYYQSINHGQEVKRMKNNITFYEIESQKFDPYKHFLERIEEMKESSSLGYKVSEKWREVLNNTIINVDYPVQHPVGRETFSLYIEYSSGIFEYALDIDEATSLIKKEKIQPLNYFTELEIIPFFYGYLSKAMYFLEIDYHHIIRATSNLQRNIHEFMVYRL